MPRSCWNFGGSKNLWDWVLGDLKILNALDQWSVELSVWSTRAFIDLTSPLIWSPVFVNSSLFFSFQKDLTCSMLGFFISDGKTSRKSISIDCEMGLDLVFILSKQIECDSTEQILGKVKNSRFIYPIMCDKNQNKDLPTFLHYVEHLSFFSSL